MSNRNPIKQWSITFPQSGEHGRKEFADKFPPYEEVIVSREEHKDGGYHLHMGIKLKKGVTKKIMLSWIKKKFPDDYKRIDVQATRSIKCWSEYISKEDPDAYREVSVKAREEQLLKTREWIKEKIGIDPETYVPSKWDGLIGPGAHLTDDDLEVVQKENRRRDVVSFVTLGKR